jgi:hypothetical protein
MENQNRRKMGKKTLFFGREGMAAKLFPCIRFMEGNLRMLEGFSL